MGCLATGPDLLADPILGTAASNPFPPAIEDPSAGSLPLWHHRTVEALDWSESAEADDTPTVSRLFWRGIVARWAITARQQWGDRANELQDAGMDWQKAERRAFEEIMERRRSTRS